jgi:predicted ester cyclase
MFSSLTLVRAIPCRTKRYCRPLFAEGATICSTAVPAPLNVNGYRDRGQAFLAGFPDISVAVVEQLEDGNKVVNRVVWAHAGAPSTGLRRPAGLFAWSGIAIDTVVDAKIAERREYSHMFGIMHQLGLLPNCQTT